MACHLQEVIEENFDTEVCQCGTKKYRCLFSVTHFINIKFSTCTVQKLNIILKCLEELITDHTEKFRWINSQVFGGNFPLSVSESRKCGYMFCTSVIDTAEFFSWTDWPVHWAGSNTENGFNLIHQLKRIIGIPVHFINECKNRNISEKTNFK